MVKISKNGKTMTISRSAYKNFYEQNGWRIESGVDKENAIELKVEEDKSNEVYDQDDLTDDDWADVVEDESELEEVTKPISEMNKKELEALAKELGIDTSSVSTNKQLRELIRNNQ